MGKDAAPGVGVPTKAKWKMNCWGGVGGASRRKMVVLNYTHLHAFIAFYHLFLGGRRLTTDEHESTRMGTLLRWESMEGRCGKRRAISGRSTRLFPRKPALVVVSG
jgi:hypothetical protein